MTLSDHTTIITESTLYQELQAGNERQGLEIARLVPALEMCLVEIKNSAKLFDDWGHKNISDDLVQFHAEMLKKSQLQPLKK